MTKEARNSRLLVLCLLNGWCFVAPRLAWAEARGGSIPRSGAVTDEQRSHRPTWGQPEGRQVFSVQASLLAPYRSTSGYARRSRLAWTENPVAAKHQPFRRHNTRWPRGDTRPTRFPRRSACLVGPVPSPGGFFNGFLSALARKFGDVFFGVQAAAFSK